MSRSLGIWRYEISNMAQHWQNDRNWPKWRTLMVQNLQAQLELRPKQGVMNMRYICVNTCTIPAEDVACSYFST